MPQTGERPANMHAKGNDRTRTAGEPKVDFQPIILSGGTVTYSETTKKTAPGVRLVIDPEVLRKVAER